jgi:hypothetical protein
MRSTSATAAIAVDLVQAVRITAKGSDINGDGFTSSLDLTALLGAWGLPDPAADINGDGTVNSVDLTMLLTGWGPCGG